MHLLALRRSLPFFVALMVAACVDLGPPAPATGDGSIVVTVRGLPAGAPSGVSVTGNGATYNVVETADLPVDAGNYTVAAIPVQVGSTTWYPNFTSQSTVLAHNQVWVVTVRYGRLPVSGTYVAELDLFDSAMVAFMSARNIGAGTLAISSAGQPGYRRGFGWRDSARTVPISPNAIMRLASNSKPLTAAAIRRLASDGRFSLGTRVFEFLGIVPSGAVIDPRIYDVTIQHLLEHTGGWNRNIAGDIMFQTRDVSQALGLTVPPTREQIAAYMMTRALQHTPGSATSYSNFGYMLLGLIVEKVTGDRLIDYVREYLFPSAMAAEVTEAHTLRNERDTREPFYSDPYKGCSVFVMDACALVPWPDGGWHIESFGGAGGLAASAPAMAAFLGSYWINGQPRTPGPNATFTFFGSLDGTFTMTRQRDDGTNLVALFNQRTDPSGLSYNEIEQVLDAAANRVTALRSLSWTASTP
jgi:CubicO group peptidase (beta-lactamase class C family)